MRDQRIEIVAYDPGYSGRFEREGTQLREALRPWLHGTPEHYGSTAVPGLAGKPVIDIMAPLAAFPVPRDVAARLGALQYREVRLEDPAMAYCLFFVKPSVRNRRYHLQLLPHDSPERARQLLFRDLLRADEELARQYENLKRTLCAQHETDRGLYTLGKGDFIERALAADRRTGSRQAT